MQPAESPRRISDLRNVDPRWRVWDLDAEMRYQPALEVLPPGAGDICEIGSGAAGIARWTTRPVIGVDPGPDERHGGLVAPANLRRVMGGGEAIPLPDESAIATIAIDTIEHIPREHRRRVLDEMVRVTAPAGRVIVIGPTGPAAAAADRHLLDALHQRGVFGGWTTWLEEHLEFGLPSLEELGDALAANARVQHVTVRGELNLRVWWMMHRAAMGVLPRVGPMRRVPRTPMHAYAWAPLAVLARQYRRGPYYRYMLVADVS